MLVESGKILVEEFYCTVFYCKWANRLSNDTGDWKVQNTKPVTTSHSHTHTLDPKTRTILCQVLVVDTSWSFPEQYLSSLRRHRLRNLRTCRQLWRWWTATIATEAECDHIADDCLDIDWANTSVISLATCRATSPLPAGRPSRRHLQQHQLTTPMYGTARILKQCHSLNNHINRTGNPRFQLIQ